MSNSRDNSSSNSGGVSRVVPPVRSLLFIPATRTELTDKGVAAGADALIFDLEDAIPEQLKDDAREQLAAFLAGSTVPVPVFVRVNGLDSSRILKDLDSVVGANVTGVLVPKVQSVREVTLVDQVVGWFERDRGLSPGHTTIVPILETAAGARAAYELALASDRTAYMGGLGTRGGDVERSFGYRWSPEGHETFVVRSTVLRDLRAAGTPNPVSGMWADIKDLDGLSRFAAQNRSIGYEGMLCIHPTHVPVINAAFTPSEDELDRDHQLVEAMGAAAAQGRGATVFDGEMIDEAMAATARRRLAHFRPESTR